MELSAKIDSKNQNKSIHVAMNRVFKENKTGPRNLKRARKSPG